MNRVEQIAVTVEARANHGEGERQATVKYQSKDDQRNNGITLDIRQNIHPEGARLHF